MSDDREERTAAERAGITVRSTWRFSLDEAQKGLAHCNPAGRETMIKAFIWCNDAAHPMELESFAKRVGYAENTLYKVFTGKYVNAENGKLIDVPADLFKATTAFLEQEQRAFEEGEHEFVKTPTADFIFKSCDLARESRSMVVLWGPSHIGKTWALRRYQQTNNHGRTFMVELDAASGLGGMVRRIASACLISDKSNTADLIGRIRSALSPSSVLIVDEVHLLQHTYRRGSFFACIEVLRRIHDFTKCGMVLSWTILDELKAASQRELQQVWRRGVHKRQLPPMPQIADLRAILNRHELAFPGRKDEVVIRYRNLAGGFDSIKEKPFELLRQVAKDDGLLAITERIRYAHKLARKAREVVDMKHFVEAHLRIQKAAAAQDDWADDDRLQGGAK